jgi:hypothetical protein
MGYPAWVDRAKIYRLKVKVPGELVGEVEVTVSKPTISYSFSGAGEAARVSSIERSNAYSGTDEGRKHSGAFRKYDGEMAATSCSSSTDTTL